MLSILSLAAGYVEVLGFAVLGAVGFPWEDGVEDDIVYIYRERERATAEICTPCKGRWTFFSYVTVWLVDAILFRHYGDHNAITSSAERGV